MVFTCATITCASKFVFLMGPQLLEHMWKVSNFRTNCCLSIIGFLFHLHLLNVRNKPATKYVIKKKKKAVNISSILPFAIQVCASKLMVHQYFISKDG